MNCKEVDQKFSAVVRCIDFVFIKISVHLSNPGNKDDRAYFIDFCFNLQEIMSAKYV